MKLIFIVTHRQSFNEQGFSINKLMPDGNMEEEPLIATINAMNSADAEAGSFLITNKITNELQESLSDKLAQASKKGDFQKSEKE